MKPRITLITCAAAVLTLWLGYRGTGHPAAPAPPAPPPVALANRAAPPSGDREATPTGDPHAGSTIPETPARRGRSYERLGAALAARNPAEAAQTLGTIDRETDRRRFIRGMADTLAQGDPAAALDFIKTLPGEANQDTALVALMESWTANDPVSPARQAWLIHDHGLEAGLGMELLEGDQPNIPLATLWANRLDESDQKAVLLAKIADQLMATDTAAAFALGKNLVGNDYIHFLQGAMESQARIDPLAAMNRAAQFPDPATRDAVQASIASGWAAMDDERSALNLLAASPPGEARNAFVKAMAERQARQNPDGASAWAATLPDAADRAIATDALDALPGPVTGIGARMDTQNGMPVVASLIGGSPAALGGQLHPGDRIMAVAQVDGAFVETRGMDLGDIVEMIRGANNSTVQLRVASPQAGGYGPPRVIQFNRRQFKGGS